MTVIIITSGQSNLTKRLQHRRTWTVQWYSPGGASVHPLIHASFGLPESKTQATFWPVQSFLHSSRQSVAILYNRQPINPFHGDLDLHLMCGSLDPSEFSTQTASWSVEPFLQGSLVWQTDRPTDHASRSVTIGRIYVRTTTIRPNNNNKWQK